MTCDHDLVYRFINKIIIYLQFLAENLYCARQNQSM